jgi:hypothetical protein
LKVFIDALPRDSSGALINKALEEATKVFQRAGVRPNAKKVLVVITDRRSGVSKGDIQIAAKPLSNAGIEVIPVAIGNEVSKDEIGAATDDKDNVIGVPTTETPESLAKKIMEKGLKRKILVFLPVNVDPRLRVSTLCRFVFLSEKLPLRKTSLVLFRKRSVKLSSGYLV